MDEMNRETHRQEDTTEIDLVQLAVDFFRIAKKRWWLFAAFWQWERRLPLASALPIYPSVPLRGHLHGFHRGKHRVLLLHHSG